MFVYITCGVAGLSAIEELIIHLSSHELQTDKKSIFGPVILRGNILVSK